MTADGKLPVAERRGYKNIFDALSRIGTEEQLKGLFVGLGPTILRAMVANVSQLVSYTQAKSFLIRHGNNLYLLLYYSMTLNFTFSLVGHKM